MSALNLNPSRASGLERLDSVELVSLCTREPGNPVYWTEFLHRFAGKLRFFVRGSVRQLSGAGTDSPGLFGAAEENDLVQATILRLVDHEYAALKRFSGPTEAELLAYFAVIARSVVRDHVRRQRAQKRPTLLVRSPSLPSYDRQDVMPAGRNISAESMEREILARELGAISMRIIRDGPAKCSYRDELVFELYFSHDLSPAQIARCKGIGLSKNGVIKVLDRLKEQVRTAADTPSGKKVVSG